jgi:hypothetical protein
METMIQALAGRGLGPLLAVPTQIRVGRAGQAALTVVADAADRGYAVTCLR